MASAAVFARTKIQPPRQRPGLLARERIAAPLAAALAQQRVVLLCAPAGFGKTVALTQQLALLPEGTALAWIGADDADDLGRFAACLVAALDPFDLPWRVSPEALVAEIDGSAASALGFATELLNALAATEVPRGLIVVDDVHRLADAAIFTLLERLVERLPEHWALVMLSRSDPPLPLARWRARGELAELRQDGLLFTPGEVAALVPQRGDAAALFNRTGGWAAGLGLLLGGASAGAAPLRDRHMFDFIASEVLDSMAPGLRGFLLRCSVLPELTAQRCAAVSGDARAAEWLELIERRGLFVSVLDEREPTLRLHDLFRDCLADRLQREQPDELPGLLHRAAADEPDALRRIGYLARAEAWPEAEAVLGAIGPAMLAAGAVPQVLRLIEMFPPALRGTSPPLQQLRGLCAWAHWDWLAMDTAMAGAAAGWRARGDEAAAMHAEVIGTIQQLAMADDAGRERLPALLAKAAQAPLRDETKTLLALSQAWNALGTSALDQVAAPFDEVVTRLERGAPLTLWFQCQPPTAFLGMPGTRGPLQRYVSGVLRLAPAEPPSALRVLALALQAGLAMFAGDADAAQALLLQADDDCRWLHRPPIQSTYLHTIGAFTQALRGEHAAALAHAQALLDGLDDPRSSGRRHNWLGHFLYLRLRIAAVLDDDTAQREMAERLQRHTVPGERDVFLRQRHCLPARAAALDGRWHDAAQGFGQALADETALDHYGQAVELRARRAQALLHDGRRDEAAAALQPALARVAASGENAGLRFAGARALAVLATADWGGRLPATALAVLRSAAQTSTATAVAPAAAEEGPLSGRELDVLARLAAGDTNKLIARTLDLSPHTVKRHVANILDKLDLRSRGQAAAWFRQR